AIVLNLCCGKSQEREPGRSWQDSDITGSLAVRCREFAVVPLTQDRIAIEGHDTDPARKHDADLAGRVDRSG
ncbi:uncharacterized, partial [Tachysurus ichikawai]